MSDLASITSLPEVHSAVLGDLAGGFHDAVNEPDGESVAAVMGFVSSTVVEAGEQLGLGPLHRISISGEAAASLVLVDGDLVIAASVVPAKALAAVEQALTESGEEQG
jgi:hypothetical protein